jgi:nicotinate phosphoribosyltransferase
MDMKDIKIYGLDNCSLALGNEPLLSFEGSLDKVQLIETTLLNLTNYPTLIASLANRLRKLYKNGIKLIEDGSKYAQTSLGGLLGAKYSYIGGIDMTTNLQISKMFGIELFKPTIAFDKNCEYTNDDFMFNELNLLHCIENKALLEMYTAEIKSVFYSNIVFQKNKIFTFDVSELDSLELYLELSLLLVKYLNKQGILITSLSLLDKVLVQVKEFKENNNVDLKIALRYEPQMLKNKIEGAFDYIILGGDFIVSSTQPALGMVYKLMEIDGEPCIKFSEEKSKQTIPGFKKIIRLYNSESKIIVDYLCLNNESDLLEQGELSC